MAGFSNSVNGLQPPDFAAGGPKLPEVSGRMPKYSRFREAVAGDRVRSTLRGGPGSAKVYANRSGEIIRWNRASAALFGYSAEEALGQSLDLIIPEHLRASHWRGFEAAITKGATKLQGRPTLTRALHKSGRKIYVEMTQAQAKRQGVPREGRRGIPKEHHERSRDPSVDA
jgi:PAS domain S-box-containing protein